MNLLNGTVKAAGFVEMAQGIMLPFDAAAFTVRDNGPVQVGIRPEDVVFAEAGQSSGLDFAPEFVEELGANRLVHGTVGGVPLVVSVATASETIEGARRLIVPPPHVHLFDAETGRSLRCAS